MLVFGEETIYVSHLPMFMPKHRYQGIWEVTFGEESDAVYRADSKKPESARLIFTLEPKEIFRLPDLTADRNSFKADVYRGHFERPGRKRILENVTVTLRKQVHWHPFRNSHSRPELLTYLLFGSGGEHFLAHWITTSPNYDQIVSITASAPLGEIRPAAQLVILQRSDSEALRADESVSGITILNQESEQPVLIKPIDLKVNSVVYSEKDELEMNELEEGP